MTKQELERKLKEIENSDNYGRDYLKIFGEVLEQDNFSELWFGDEEEEEEGGTPKDHDCTSWEKI